MDRLQTAVLLTYLVDQMRARGGWCGETHIQKAAYVVQQLGGVPLGFDFILYKHGPFSFDLRDELTSLRADGQLLLEPQPFPYGPKFKSTEAAHELRERFPKTLAKHKAPLDFVARKLAAKQVDELERLATAFFAQAAYPDDKNSERASWIHQMKPHVSFEEATDALREVDSLNAEFKEPETT